MQYIKGLEAYTGTKKSAVTLGKFDGLHRGHIKLIETVKALALEQDLDSIVCAFDMLPLKEKLHLPGRLLMTKEERKLMLEETVDYLVDCPFTEDFAHMSAEDFISMVLQDVFKAAFVVVGSDFRFGYEAKGDVHMLELYAKEFGYELIVIEKERYGDREISSTYIREALEEGNMELVETLLGYPYMVTGVVEEGKKLGRTLGFPTLNVAPASEKLMPPKGVYVGRVNVDGLWYNAIGNVGVKPTVSNANRMLIESFLLDYEGNAYGKEVIIELCKFQRPEHKFLSKQQLKEQVDKDIAAGKQYFGLD